MKRIIVAVILCLSIISCSKITENFSVSDDEPRDMDWYYKHNGYAIMTVQDTRNQPVMEIIAIPLNSEAILTLVHGDVEDVSYYIRRRIERQRPVFYMTVYAHRDCVFSWPSLKLEQAGGIAIPTTLTPAKSPLMAAADRLYAKYGEMRVREVDRFMGLFTNPFTGRAIYELSSEIELAQGESLSVIAFFSGGFKINKPFYLISKSGRYVLSSGSAYTTREAKKLIQLYQPAGID